MNTGVVRLGGKSRSSASETIRAWLSAGSTRASTDVKSTRRNGRPRTIIRVADAAATRPGRRITKRDRRYQKPDSAGRASASLARLSRRGASALTRCPSSVSTAGSSTSATVAAISDTSIPPSPIEYRNFCGKTSSDASAAATVSDENRTVRPAVFSVRRIATIPGPCSASSSR